jgi:acetyl esterase/lipase
MHGGGWYFGQAAYQNDIRLCNLCNTLQIAIVSVDYRLAPEYSWPAPLHDCMAAATWLQYACETEFQTNVLLLGGESAGGHLAMCTLLHLLHPQKTKNSDQVETTSTSSFTNSIVPQYQCVNFVYGIYDLHATPSMRQYGNRPLIFNYTDFLHCSDMLLGESPYNQKYQHSNDQKDDEPETTEAKEDGSTTTRQQHQDSSTIYSDRCAPEISPLYADLTPIQHLLPPALFTVGTDDPLYDDSVFMAHRYATAAALSATTPSPTNVQLAIYVGGAHGIGHFGPHAHTALGKQCHAKIETFLASFL